MKRFSQLGFEILEKTGAKFFGGAHLKNSNPKTKRPITTKRPMHLVLRSTKAKGARSFLRFERTIRRILKRQAGLHGVKIYRIANAGNHLHLIILPHSRIAYNRFIRSISGLLARLVLEAEKGSAKSLQFWDQRPFTRVVEWGREFRMVSKYLTQNTLEALGFIPYQPRGKRPLINSTA